MMLVFESKHANNGEFQSRNGFVSSNVSFNGVKEIDDRCTSTKFQIKAHKMRPYYSIPCEHEMAEQLTGCAHENPISEMLNF